MAKTNEEFEQLLEDCLETLKSGQQNPDTLLSGYPDQVEGLRPPLEAAAWLATRTEFFNPRPGFVSASRKRLVDRIITDQSNNGAQTVHKKPGFWESILEPFTKKRFALGLALAVVALLFFAAGGTTLAARRSLPGDSLYNVKLAAEDARLFLTLSPEGDAKLHLQFAQRRLDEIESLVALGAFDRIQETTLSFEEEVHEAVSALNRAGELPDDQAQLLATSLENILDRQRALLLVLAEKTPQEVYQSFDQTAHDTEVDLSSAADTLRSLIIISPTPPLPAEATSTPAPTDVPGSAASPEPSLTPTPPETHPPGDPTRTDQPTPTKTPSTAPTETKTQKPGGTPTPAPAINVQPTRTNTPSPDELRPTRKPTKTDRPDEKERPPERSKPTQRPKPTKAANPTTFTESTREPRPTKAPKPPKP